MILNIVFPYRLYLEIKKIKTKIFTIWLSKQFGEFGNNSSIGKHGWYQGLKYIHIGDNCGLGDYMVLTAWDTYFTRGKKHKMEFVPQIVIGNQCSLGSWNHITAINNIYIGDNCLTGKWVTITDHSHGDTDYLSLTSDPINRSLKSKGAIIIGKNVWIGDKATILAPVKIGDGAVIAANAVVTKDVPPYCVVAGNPASIIKRCVR